ncbi:2-oxoglutarate dehydrogenase E2 component (dihydrolipoamide succinyltransferase) [Filimonas lacunae]|uniref:Dihydrolipoamide acetyltransferase component of pyruvate dehydrogenase complex n=1 Tax=Filimonas lacunae TaxID=477680 RepID=A0A173MAT6_9BACT|nr:dihydrolipoamide acetyltransferase family protein [Filimonas lacunae]BAV04601.1 dihydrolipoamide acyltransferase component of branched-chain alpha-keto acid dehydrogenase complex [Filimonas lacunae]SIT32697.1 2-oxoglutarate dehydrogenase E2 component (dihydrolipoamide succinyltransferase) [Filimonas lacunae]
MALVDLVMPKLGESIMEATVLRWHKKTGDTVELEETVLEIATDKVDSEVPSTAAGVITEVLFNENDVVPIGTVIARIETAAVAPVETPAAPEQAPAISERVTEEPEPEVPFVPQEPVHAPAVENAAPATGGARFYSPLVLNIVNSEGISLAELEKIPGTGNDGRVTKKDILQYVAQRNAGTLPQPVVENNVVDPVAATTTPEPVAQPVSTEQPTVAPETTTPAVTEPKTTVPQTAVTATTTQAPVTYPTGNVEIIEMDRMRKLIAKHMVDSVHTSPHVTSFAEADVTNMVQWRDRVKKDFEKRENTKITFTPLFIDCIARVIKRYPIINSSVDGDKIILKKDINIGMATALPSGNLIVPVIKNADYLNLVGLSKAVNFMADSARNNRLKPDDTQGGTFTLTNVGTFGSLMGTPIISQPQVAILAVGAIKKRAVVIETEQGDTIGIRHMMYLSMSYDHRIVDGSIGASFLSEVAKEFENWDPNRGVL